MFRSYADYVESIDILLRCDAFPEPTFLWWDVRLQPRFGTLEMRVMDAQTRVADTAALTALVQCLVHLEALEGHASHALVSRPEVLEENRFIAARDGMEARFVDPETERRRPAREWLGELLDVCAPHAAELGCSAELETVRALAAAPGAARQRSRAGRGATPQLGRVMQRAARRLHLGALRARRARRLSHVRDRRRAAARGRAPDRDALERMSAALAPRGPDGDGHWFHDGTALAHRRLAIIDLSERGAQPMVDEELGLTVVFNGCIYNHRELRAELEGAGMRFRSDSDTEVLLKGWAAWGEGMLDRLAGMFAFCLVEHASGRCVLARDRLGKKPLYLQELP